LQHPLQAIVEDSAIIEVKTGENRTSDTVKEMGKEFCGERTL